MRHIRSRLQQFVALINKQ